MAAVILMSLIFSETDGQGHMVMKVTKCEASIQKIDVKLNGSPFSWLYNFFDDLLADNVRGVMQDGVSNSGAIHKCEIKLRSTIHGISYRLSRYHDE